MENMTDAVIVIDIEDYIVDLNPAAVTLLDVPSRDGSVQNLSELLEAHDVLFHLYRVVVTQGTGECLEEAQLGDNETFVEVQINRLTDSDGDIIGHLMMLRNVTPRRKAELMAARRMAELMALQAIDERITSTLNLDDVLDIAMHSAVEMTGADTGFINLIEESGQFRIVKVIGGYSESLVDSPYDVETGIAGRVARNLKAEWVQNVNDDPDYVVDVENTIAEMVIPLMTHERLVGLLVLETSVPNRFNDEVFEFARLLAGRIAIAVENAALYEESRRHVEELQLLYDHVSALEKEKTEIIRIAAHDLRNPVSTLIGFLDLFKIDRDRLDPDHQEFVDTMAEQAERMDTLINDILSLERFQHGGNRKVVNLVPMANQAFQEHLRLAEQKGIIAKISTTPEPLMIDGDPVQLREAMINLLTNAIKYTPADGIIDVVLHKADNRAVYEVRDTGYGIPLEKQERLFQPFYRATMPETSEIKGTGLGLNLVKNIIERHEGILRFESVYGQGSTFGFDLPLVNPEDD